jgi:hypothetical protein
MADAIEGTDIVAMHENIVKKLSDQFKDDFKLIEFYRSENDRTPLKKKIYQHCCLRFQTLN